MAEVSVDSVTKYLREGKKEIFSQFRSPLLINKTGVSPCIETSANIQLMGTKLLGRTAPIEY